MNSKSLLLGIYLLSLTTLVLGDQQCPQKQGLMEELQQKEKKLIDLGKRVTEQEEVIASLKQKILALRQEYIERKKTELSRKMPNQLLLEEQINTIINEVNEDLRSFMQVYFDKKNSRSNSDVLTGAFWENFDIDYVSCDAMLKFNSIRFYFECRLLARLIAQWEECLAETEELYAQL